MRHHVGMKTTSVMMTAAGVAILLTNAALAQTKAGCVTSLDPAKLGPTSIIGQGPNGEKAASVDQLRLTDDEIAKVKAGHFKVGITMQTVNLDWSQLQVQGVTDTLNKYDVQVIGVASAEYQVDKQIADIENTIQRHPDGIISIPVDGTATAATYKKISEAGIKLVFMDNVPPGLKHPEQYASMISADSQGNGWIAAQILASCVPDGGTIGLVNFGVDYFSTNERTKGVRDWMAKNRPDIQLKQVDFTDPSKVAQIAGDFLTANPDVQGLFAVWDQPALDALSSMRAQGLDIPVATVDLGLESCHRDRQRRAAQGHRLTAALRSGRCRGAGHDEGVGRADAAGLGRCAVLAGHPIERPRRLQDRLQEGSTPHRSPMPARQPSLHAVDLSCWCREEGVYPAALSTVPTFYVTAKAIDWFSDMPFSLAGRAAAVLVELGSLSG